MTKIAVIGASSYEGRHMLLSLLDRGLAHIGFDDDRSQLRPGQTDPDNLRRIDIHNSAEVLAAFRSFNITDVIHLPHRGTVAKSLKDPLDAFEAVLTTLMSVLRASAEAGLNSFVLSSTASVYGTPATIPVPETAPLNPISPLGTAAMSAERMLRDVCAAYAIPYTVLRYFNAAGADPTGRADESAAPKHLITAAIRVATGLRQGPLRIYGDDYDTPDGTAIRDYVHVADVAGAHIDAVEYLRAGGSPITLNCGYGAGASVQDVIKSVERVTGRPLDVIVEGRRDGDPPQLIADTATIRSVLGWQPQYNDLDLIVRTAMDWETRHGLVEAEHA